MKDYKRLTKWSELGTLHVFDINGKEIPLYDVSPVDTDNLAGRLAEFEDKIERGELVEVPKGAVVLTPEERAEEMRLANEELRKAVKEFAERVKMAFYYEFDELIPSIMTDKIDEIVKEVLNEHKL